MRDLAFVAIVVAFFALASAYVRMCNWLIGRDTFAGAAIHETEGDGPIAAAASEVAS